MVTPGRPRTSISASMPSASLIGTRNLSSVRMGAARATCVRLDLVPFGGQGVGDVLLGDRAEEVPEFVGLGLDGDGEAGEFGGHGLEDLQLLLGGQFAGHLLGLDAFEVAGRGL